MGVGKYVQSRTFIVGGYDWAIRFYPNGRKQSITKEYVTVYLVLISNMAQVRARYELKVLGQFRGSSDFRWSNTWPRSFRSWDGTRFGPRSTSRFCLKSELEQEGYIRNDCLTIECDLTVVESQSYDISVDPEIYVPPCDISQHLGKWFDQKDGSDVTFFVGRETFTAHKVVLAARSPVFKAEFYGQMKETMMRHVTIKDMLPPIFKTLLYFIYTGSLLAMDHLDGDEYNNMICHLLAAADRYALDRLKLMCQRFLSRDLNVGNLATTLDLANLHNCKELKEACIKFIILSNEMSSLVASLGYTRLKGTRLAFLVDVPENTTKRRKI